MDLARSLQAFGSVPFSHGALLPLLSDYQRPNATFLNTLIFRY